MYFLHLLHYTSDSISEMWQFCTDRHSICKKEKKKVCRGYCKHAVWIVKNKAVLDERLFCSLHHKLLTNILLPSSLRRHESSKYVTGLITLMSSFGVLKSLSALQHTDLAQDLLSNVPPPYYLTRLITTLTLLWISFRSYKTEGL